MNDSSFALPRAMGDLRWVVVASRLAIAATCTHWLLDNARLELLVGVCALGLTWAPAAFLRDDILRAPTQSLVAFLLAAHIVLGMALGLYERSSVYDKWVHLVAFGAMTALILLAVTRYCTRHRLAPPFQFIQLFVLTCALSLGTFWELFEFSIDRTGWFTAQRGLHDTMLDLVANLSGVLLVLGSYSAWRRLLS